MNRNLWILVSTALRFNCINVSQLLHILIVAS